MSVKYTPLTQVELNAIGLLEGFPMPQWTGPALPRPVGQDGIAVVVDTATKLAARSQYLIQAEDALSVEYTLNGITAKAERFLFGTQQQVEETAALDSLVVLVESFLNGVLQHPAHESSIRSALASLGRRLKTDGEELVAVAADLVEVAAESKVAEPDYSAFTLEDPTQFSMSWTTFEDAFRDGYPHVGEYVRNFTDPQAATEAFWPMISRTALPYNLFVVQRLTQAGAQMYKTNFGTGWLPEYDALLADGKLYGIDMTIFSGLAPETSKNGTKRVTPCSMGLLAMDHTKNMRPIAVYVADPQNAQTAQVYTAASPAWTYALLALKSSMTVYGIWLGHVYSLHIVTAAMQMATLNTLPDSNIIHQLLAPQSNYLIPFDLILMVGWPSLSPPTSIGDPGKFLTICNRFSAAHPFFATDPHQTLERMNLDPADFTDASQPGGEWNLYPNVQMILKIWNMCAAYVGAVVDAGYTDDAAVLADANLQAWIEAATSPCNVAGLPRMDSKQALKNVVTSILYRITFHGMGRLRSIGTPLPSFAPNYPPCLQSANIPDPSKPVTTADLLATYLPNTGTLGKLVAFYGIFAYNAPYEPVVPNKGAEDELFFNQATHPAANAALIAFRKEIESIIRDLQPTWVQIGQWPRNIEL
jgi:hypothetical protein